MANGATATRDGTGAIRATIAGNRLELIESGRGRLEALLTLIREAKSSLRLLFYIFQPDSTGTMVRDALVEAAARGVKVRLLLDGYGSADARPDFFEPIAGEGGDFCLFHPRYGRRYLLRNHQKLVVADEKVALIGGANIHDDYMTDEGERHWRDLWLRIEGPQVEPAAEYFDALYRWTTTKGAKLRALRRLVYKHTQNEGPLQWKFSRPLSLRNPWPTGFAHDLESACRVEIISAYFSPPRSVLRRVGLACRHACVRVITAAKSDNNATVAAARYNYSRMLRRGVEMYEYQAARLHTKLAITDDAVHIGSSNFDLRSFYINLEIMLRIEDPGFAEAMRGYFERELAQSERITPSLHRKRATALARLQWTIAHFLVTSMDYTVTRRLNFNRER